MNVENACGVCGTGTEQRRCSDRYVWEAVACDDPLDRDADGVPNEACDDVLGGCCTDLRDCNDMDAARHPETFECTFGLPPESESCTTDCGTTGTRTCGPDCEWYGCAVLSDGCNGVDDDCDDETDEDVPCLAGSTVACETACGSDGTGTCSASCEPPLEVDCTPPGETCANGADDDCDTETDEAECE
jgi:hypothetical protein